VGVAESSGAHDTDTENDMTRSTESLRREYAITANRCVAKINDIRRMSGRSDRCSLKEFNRDIYEDIVRATGATNPTPEQWVRAAKSRARDIAA